MLKGPQPKNASDYLFLWHGVSLDATSTDHLPLLTGSSLTYHEQFGPPRTSRALALVHLAMFEALNGLTGQPYTSYLGVHTDVDKGLDPETVEGAAVVEAAYQTLSWLYPGLNQSSLIGEQKLDNMPVNCTTQDVQKFSFSFYYQCSLLRLNNKAPTDAPSADSASVSAGRAFGRAVFVALLAARANDGSSAQDPTFDIDFLPVRIPVDGVFPLLQWQPDPVSKLKLALGGNWGKVKPFALSWGGELRIPEEQSAIARFSLATTEKTHWPSYELVLKYGVEPRLQKTGLKVDQLVDVAKFWAYDGTAGLCAPVRLYNELADEYLAQVAKPLMKTVVDEARYYALLNLAMADAAVAAWDSKYHFQLARPVTVIRSHQTIEDIGSKIAKPALVFEKGPALSADSLPPGAPGTPVSGISEDIGPQFDHLWYPLGAQNSNAATPYNITPPFPAYPSGHAVFGGAVFGILRQFVPEPTKSKPQFTFQSDEYNGKNADAYNFLRCSKDDPQTGPGFCNNVQPTPGRTFTLDCAERENADSRVFMGVHWGFDADDGVEMGNEVALHVWNMLLQPNGSSDKRQFSQFVETTSKRSADQIRSYAAYTEKERRSLVCPNVTYPNAVLKGFDQVAKSGK